MPPGISYPSLDQDGHQISTPRLGRGGGYRITSHNYCDPCSWWQGSTHDPLAATVETVPLVEYTIAGAAGVIDLRHGRVVFEDAITAVTTNPVTLVPMTDLVPSVFVNGILIPQANEDAPAGADRYTIDYPAHKIVFAVARGVGDVVTVSCRRAASSVYVWRPGGAGTNPLDPLTKYRVVLEDAECDMTADIDQDRPMQMQAWGSHTVATGGTIVPVDTRLYKRFRDWHAVAREFYGPIPAGFGGTGGDPSPRWTFRWQYSRSDVMYYDPNYLDMSGFPLEFTLNYLGLSIPGDVALPGTCVTFTLFGGSSPQDAP
jgi:hypothetical protein